MMHYDSSKLSLINVDTGVHPTLLNARFGYVSISRASHQITIFTDEVPKMAQMLGADVTKTSALEVSQTPSVRQEMGSRIIL